jgi:hypothetical protein
MLLCRPRLLLLAFLAAMAARQAAASRDDNDAFSRFSSHAEARRRRDAHARRSRRLNLERRRKAAARSAPAAGRRLSPDPDRGYGGTGTPWGNDPSTNNADRPGEAYADPPADQDATQCDHADWSGDGSCDVVNNNPACRFDGGDCCEDTSRSGVVDTTYCPGDCVCRDPASAKTGTVYATFDDLGAYHGPDIQVVNTTDPVVRSTAEWFVDDLNAEMEPYSSSRLSLQKVLHAFYEADTVFFNEEVDGEQVQFPVLGRTYSLVVLTEQRVRSRLYREIEVPLWEVRNATVFNTSFSYEPPYLIHHHVPPREPLDDARGFALADLAIDSINGEVGRPRYTISHYGSAERQCLDIDDTDLFYELDEATHEVVVCLSYVHFACDDADWKGGGDAGGAAYAPVPRLFIAAVYTDPQKYSHVVSVMDLQTTKDVDFASLKRIVRADSAWEGYYEAYSVEEPWLFLAMSMLAACFGLSLAFVCSGRGASFSGRGFFRPGEVGARESVSLKYESAGGQGEDGPASGAKFAPVSTVEF